MSENKIYLIVDENGNYFRVNNWEGLFTDINKKDIEELYIYQKWHYIIEETMVEFEEKNLIEKVSSGAAPLEELANSIDKISEFLGSEKIKELDERVQEIIQSGLDNPNPSNFMHLN